MEIKKNNEDLRSVKLSPINKRVQISYWWFGDRHLNQLKYQAITISAIKYEQE